MLVKRVSLNPKIVLSNPLRTKVKKVKFTSKDIENIQALSFFGIT